MLLMDWLQVSISLMSEMADDITGGYRRLIAEAQRRASQVGVEWSDDIVPNYVQERLAWAKEEERG